MSPEPGLTLPPLPASGLDQATFPPIAFVDADGTLFKPGTDEWMDGVEEKFRRLSQKYRICLFTARSPGPWMEVVGRVLGKGFMYMCKPLGDHYLVFDDRLAGGGQCLPSD